MSAPAHEHSSPHPPAAHRGHGSRARILGAALAVASALLGLVATGAAPAFAGGPTSVLIVNYDGARAAGALTGSKAYDDLTRALDVYSDPAGEKRSADDFMSAAVRLTWMIHDVTPWRIDAVFLDGKDVWVSTSVSRDGRSLFDTPAVWHRPKDAGLLLATLTSLGVVGAKPVSGANATATPAAVARPAPAAAGPQGAGSGTPAWWLTAAVGAAGLGLGLVIARTRRADGSRPARAAGMPPREAGMPPGESGTPRGAPGTAPAGIREGGIRESGSRPSPVGFTPDNNPERR